MNRPYTLDVLDSLDDQMIISSEADIDYGRIRRKKRIAIGLAASLAIATMLLTIFLSPKPISIYAYADDGKITITEKGTTISVDMLSESDAMSRGFIQVALEAPVRLVKLDRWENGKFLSSTNYTEEFNTLFNLLNLWENRDVDPLEELLRFEFEDKTVITKQFTLKAIDDETWLASFKDITNQ